MEGRCEARTGPPLATDGQEGQEASDGQEAEWQGEDGVVDVRGTALEGLRGIQLALAHLRAELPGQDEPASG